MEHFTLEPLAARHGDCLLLHFGPADAPRTILIDGGPSQVYAQSLKPRLNALAKNRPGGKFAIDLLMVSHIDDDHIRGVIDFTEEWRDAKTDHADWPWPVLELWHNSFERIAGGSPTDVRASVLSSFGAQSFADIAALDEGHDGDGDPAEMEDRHAALKILASVGQGSQLRKDADLLGIPTNTGFPGHLVRPGDDPTAPVPMGDTLKLHIVGPLPEQIDALRAEFAKGLPTGPEASLAAYVDNAVPNLSSIVVLAVYRGKSVLLTGDARGDFILEGLRRAKLLEDRLHIDVLKMQHHASIRNTATEFFQTVTADHYVASANGKFENPDRETFEAIVAARPKGDKYVIHLTGEIAEMDAVREKERTAARDKAIKAGKKKVPAAWDADKDALATFFAKCKQDGFAFEVHTPAQHRVPIDLLDPIGF